MPSAGLIAALRHDSGPPLFYLIERPFAWLAGRGAGDAWLRVLPLAATLLLFRAARTLPAGRARTAFAALLAGSLLLNLYAAEARPYAVLALLTSALFLTALRGAETPARLAATVALAAAALYTHYLAAFCVLALAILAAATRRAGSVAALAAGAVLFGPWLPILLAQPAEAVAWMRESSGSSAAGFLSALGGVGRAPLPFGAPVPPPLFLAGIAAGLGLIAVIGVRARTDRDTRLAAIYTALVLGGVLAAGAIRPVAFAGRTEMAILPIWFWAAARAADSLRTARWAAGAAAALGALATAGYLHLPHGGSESLDAAERVARAARPGDVVLAAAGFYLPARVASERYGGGEVRALSPGADAHPGWFLPALPGADEARRAAESAASLEPGGRLFLVLPPGYATEELGRALEQRPGRVRELQRSADVLVILWTPDPGSARDGPVSR